MKLDYVGKINKNYLVKPYLSFFNGLFSLPEIGLPVFLLPLFFLLL